eukprot:3343396-Lingulodinium_polyedra.AAC.1
MAVQPSYRRGEIPIFQGCGGSSPGCPTRARLAEKAASVSQRRPSEREEAERSRQREAETVFLRGQLRNLCAGRRRRPERRRSGGVAE